MKFTKLFLITLAILIALVAAQDEAAQEEAVQAEAAPEEAAPEETTPEAEGEAQAEEATPEPEEEPEPEPEVPKLNCDHVCGRKLGIDTAEISRRKQVLSKKLLGRSMHAQAVIDESEDYKFSLQEVSILAEEAKEAADVAQQELEATQHAAAGARKRAEECKASSESKIKALEAELAAAKAEVENYRGIKFSINVDLIKGDFMNLLKKYGLVKE
mmetsp:Transcript_134310/g.199892  ORF Transcript_134310/g.199892 Transcript_134310/m.199892 type:complete len:215 (+) Transcript_134310:78-722(+)|eukprot:CAMPEP_0117038766 /NCGR_PEP_ID=MMETSP0472-20121206/27252_1 /TAXON_ID=693140 ORGANISM="Tiarina fusus, Strain LIS" /NCGR_SAMPLE_ID=MMETSP0472 /ASSEMBLY_ACC=CAM_ASM_000603 /LENGTH=214 /DNA_ID=CAMNT_0004749075 /DNA_START=78 /DNA_END=722 /DNA_ORIENTATION=-